MAYAYQNTSYNAVKIAAQPLDMSYSSRPIQLSIPKIGSQISKASSTDDYQTLLPWHMAFRANATHITDEKKARVKASAELKAIQITFPGLQTPAVILAMAGLLFTYCAQDDWLEQLHPATAEATLRHCIDIMRSGSYGARRSSQAANDELFKHLDEHSQNIVKIWTSFQTYLKSLMPAQIDYDIVSNDIAVCMVGFIDEAWFRAEKSTSIEEYLRIRTLTIGPSTFFELYRVETELQGCLMPATTQLSHLVTTIVGLHNDLLGMEKDLRTGEWMNLAMVLVEGQDMEAVEAMNQTVATVNVLVARATSIYEEIAAGCASGVVSLAEEAYAREVLAFVERHLQWIMIAKRYKK